MLEMVARTISFLQGGKCFKNGRRRKKRKKQVYKAHSEDLRPLSLISKINKGRSNPNLFLKKCCVLKHNRKK